MWLSLIISGAITIIAFCFQLSYFNRNRRTAEGMELFFPSDDTNGYQLVEGSEEVKQIQIPQSMIMKNGVTSLQSLLSELNNYIKRNVGTTDFAVIQNKTERFTETIYEDATSMSSMPTYIGLMGTFFGVLLGLFFFSADFVNSDDEKIKGLIYGVMVSMLTSLIGLFLTTWSNHLAAQAKKRMDERKNVFYDFVQNELMPTLGTSVVESLAKLKETINNFVPAFNIVISSFRSTFDECTRAFGNEFRSNVTVVTDAIRVMGQNIGELNAVSSNVRLLLQELRTGQMTETLQKFIDSVHSIDNLEENIVYLEQQKEFLNTSTQELMDAQAAYLLSLELPQDIANKLTSILNRFVNFENNINKLGDELAQTQMLSNNEINLVRQQINALDRKTRLLDDYQSHATEELQRVCDVETENVRHLTRQYTEALDEHSQTFSNIIESVANEIQNKRKELMDVLERTFDVTEIRTEFNHLKELPEIVRRLESVERALKVDSDLLDKLESIRTSGIDIYNNQDKYFKAIEENQEHNYKAIEETQQKVENLQNYYQQSLSDIHRRLNAIDLNALENSTDEIKKSVGKTIKEFDALKSMMSKFPTEDVPTDMIKNIDKKVSEILKKILEGSSQDYSGTGWSFFGRKRNRE
jgi:hypothetical protein